MTKVAMLSMHTSPLAQAGVGDAGGMNIYVKELAGSLARLGVECTIYTRRWDPLLPESVEVEPGLRVVHVDAGAPDLDKGRLDTVVEEFAAGVRDHLENEGADVIHANYWLSGLAGHRLKHELDLPLVSTFHTLARVKAEGGDREPWGRDRAETEIIGCSDAVLVSCQAEGEQLRRLYGEPPGRIEVVEPGVDHAVFGPGSQVGARRGVGLEQAPTVLFVGRIQPLKGVDVAVRALAALSERDARLVIIGGASGPEGRQAVTEVRRLIAALGLADRVRFVDPQPHHLLSSWYRAADVVLVPSRSESFGLVALEAAACGVPVVAAIVGGLTTLVDHGSTGFLVEGRDPAVYAAYLDKLLGDDALARMMGASGARRARRYTWSSAAGHLWSVVEELAARRLVACN